MRRRTVLALTGSSLVALAGCSSGDDDGDDGPEPVNDTVQDGDDNDTDADGDDSDGQDGDGQDGDDTDQSTTELVEAFIGDLSSGDMDAAFENLSDPAKDQSSAGALEAVWLGFTNVGGEYQTITDTETTVQGGFDAADVTMEFARGNHTMRIILGENGGVRSMLANDPYERPDYADKSNIKLQETQLELENCILSATISDPDPGDGDVPGVVLVHGNDPFGGADKDLTTGVPGLDGEGSKPFQDIADGLANQGVAVMRYDRRSYGCPQSLDVEEQTLDAISVNDALEAINLLRDYDGVDPDRVAVAGHSLGGLAMPRIINQDDNLMGGIGLAAPAREFHELVVAQYEYLANVGEYDWENMQQIADQWQTRAQRIVDGDYKASDGIIGYAGALWQSLEEYDHIETARSVDAPMYFLQGTRDYQVTQEDDFTVLQSELGDRAATVFQDYDGLNHLFQDGTGPSVPAEYSLYNPVDEAVVKDIAGWVTEL
jgi:pimeloyl-ACP methyl ester carboxylesterase